MRRLRLLTDRHRAPSTNEVLGVLLSFNAGAINAGGFLVLHQYTSHMSGFLSQLADGLALRSAAMVLTAIGAILAFATGAATTAWLVSFARVRRFRSIYALPLLLEALLLLPFGLLGALTLNWETPFYVPATVLLLSFMMGLQNAVGSKSSAGSIRTTHMTGNLTDLGMELGKALYRLRPPRRHDNPIAEQLVIINVRKMRLTLELLLAFLVGGVAGAIGFQRVGFVFVIPFAILLFTLAWIPTQGDIWRWYRTRNTASAAREHETRSVQTPR